jgi:hypothetical protein
VEAADPVIETRAKVRKCRAMDAKERFDFLRRELEPERQAGAGGISKEVFLEILVGEQPAECPFHIPLAHAVLPALTARAGPGRRSRLSGKRSFRSPSRAMLSRLMSVAPR